MRVESSILGLVEIVGGVAIAAAVREIAEIQVAVRTWSWLPAASRTRHVLENADGSLAAMACEA